MTRYVLPLVVLAALVGFLAVGLNRDPGFVPSPLVGKPAPDFDLPRLDAPDQRLRKADLLGDVSLVNVWGTWCVGCRQEHPFLNEIARSGEIRIYGLNWKDDPASAREWLDRLGNPYAAVAVDADGRSAIDWGVYGAPETFLLDARGMVLYKHIAPLDAGVWAAEFAPRIAAARGRQQ